MRIDGHAGHVEFDGVQVTVHKKLRGTTTIGVRHIAGVSIERAGLGMRGIRFAAAGGSVTGPATALGSHAQLAQDPYALTFRKKQLPEFEELRDAVLNAIRAQAS